MDCRYYKSKISTLAAQARHKAVSRTLSRLSGPRHHLIEDVFSVVGTANERAGEHPADAEAAADLAELFEFVGMVILFDFCVFHGWPQILADRKDVDACFDRVSKQLDNLFFRFTETHHNSCFGVSLGTHSLRSLQQPK